MSSFDVIVMSVHGTDGRTLTTDLVKSGVVYGDRVRLYDPAISLLSTLGNTGVDLATFANEGDDEQHRSFVQSLIAVGDLDVASLVGLAERDLVELIDPISREEIGEGRSTELFVGRFAELLRAPNSFAMLDRPAGRVFRELIESNNFVLHRGAEGRIKEASTANGLLGHLPRFKTATLDDVLGIRESLADALPRFRGAVSDLASDIESDAGTIESFDEIDEAWRSEVAPANARNYGIDQRESIPQESDDLRSRAEPEHHRCRNWRIHGNDCGPRSLRGVARNPRGSRARHRRVSSQRSH